MFCPPASRQVSACPNCRFGARWFGVRFFRGGTLFPELGSNPPPGDEVSFLEGRGKFAQLIVLGGRGWQVLARIAAQDDGTNSNYLFNPAVIDARHSGQMVTGQRGSLDCRWVGSLDFHLGEVLGVFHGTHKKSCKLLAKAHDLAHDRFLSYCQDGTFQGSMAFMLERHSTEVDGLNSLRIPLMVQKVTHFGQGTQRAPRERKAFGDARPRLLVARTTRF